MEGWHALRTDGNDRRADDRCSQVRRLERPGVTGAASAWSRSGVLAAWIVRHAVAENGEPVEPG
jgi:hypothetical protein